ncbi:MAG: glycogen debranching enzyme family protein [Alphaproteobacteria bacterium]|nr:glycogen debranching enzyme family protein [Alphaproteobacteria bacterium]
METCLHRFDHGVASKLVIAERREWLVTNGIGGYACGTVVGGGSRAYHGLLIAALEPPVGRVLMVVKFDDFCFYQGIWYPLTTNRWRDGSVVPVGYLHMDAFWLEGRIPVWRFACGGAMVEKRIWMEPGANATYVRYTVVSAEEPVRLRVDPILDHRDHHGFTVAGDWHPSVEQIWTAAIRFIAFAGAAPLTLVASGGTVTTAGTWNIGYDLAIERERGLPDHEDHYHAATFEGMLTPGASFTILATAGDVSRLDESRGEAALERRRIYEQGLLVTWERTTGSTSKKPGWVRSLVLAADQFIVTRASPGDSAGKTIIAGYPWFTDWGRDTMISLPGLTLATGRPEVARAILHTFARYVSEGMLPNRFPDAGVSPQYNTVDATLWYFTAIDAYHAATGDDDTLRRLFPVLEDIIAWHRRGTRHGIRLDPHDGLIHSGEDGVALTWMDVRIGDWAVTPRTGKAVEINALWHKALVVMAAFARRLGHPAGEYDAMAVAAAQGFDRFWNAGTGYCYDVIDGPGGPDPALRPNQILAVSLSGTLLAPDRQAAVVAACARALLTPAGLRTLAPDAAGYHGQCVGGPFQRDSAYHQGTVWPWLLGPYIEAHWRVHRDKPAALALLESFGGLLQVDCVGTLPEICDGDAPFRPRGCFAQAWSVGEALRVWGLLDKG